MIKLLIIFSFVLPIPSLAQSEEKLVREPIDRLFLAMQKGDSALLHTVFAKVVTMATISMDKNNQSSIRYESGISNLLKAVGTPHADALNEPIWDLKINIDGNFAQVWAQYAFYVGNRFSHCGVDAFHLVKGNEEWKIFHLADTRYKEGCSIPKEISDRYK
jgi:hypothetical protein